MRCRACHSTASRRTSAPRSCCTRGCSLPREPQGRLALPAGGLLGPAWRWPLVGGGAAQCDREALQGAYCRRHQTGPPHRALRYAKQRAILLFSLSTNPVSLLLSHVRSIIRRVRCWPRCRSHVQLSPHYAVRSALAPLALGTPQCYSRWPICRSCSAFTRRYISYMCPWLLRSKAGSVMLLTTALHVLIALRRPSTAALAWQQANLARRTGATTAAREKPKVKL